MLPDLTSLTLFLAASLILLITPGPAVFYIVARSIDQGRLAGVVSMFGVAAGSLVHIAAAALGLSAILVSSATAFSIVKYLGAAYLIYLGVKRLLDNSGMDAIQHPESKTLHRMFWEGVVVNILNPKTALFFLAFLPQFVDPDKGNLVFQFMLLGSLFVVLGIITDGIYALLSGTARHALRGHSGFWQVQRYFAGGIFIMLGVATALTGSGKK